MSNFNENKPSKFLMYYDVRNLYGYAMRQYLPFNNFKWIDKENFEKLDINQSKVLKLQKFIEFFVLIKNIG